MVELLTRRLPRLAATEVPAERPVPLLVITHVSTLTSAVPAPALTSARTPVVEFPEKTLPRRVARAPLLAIMPNTLFSTVLCSTPVCTNPVEAFETKIPTFELFRRYERVTYTSAFAAWLRPTFIAFCMLLIVVSSTWSEPPARKRTPSKPPDPSPLISNPRRIILSVDRALIITPLTNEARIPPSV